jgi:N6-adenosine-specific RNA methylase IME4
MNHIPLLRGLPRRHFPCIVADVPWRYEVRAASGTGRSAENHYATMTLAEIEALPVAEVAADNARLFFWVTGPFIAIGSHVPIMRAWGFEPVAVFSVWVKPSREAYFSTATFLDCHSFVMNLGHTSRQNAEYVIEGRRGKPAPRKRRDVRQVIVEPMREHSRKPEKFFKRVEAYCDGPRLELFGRQRRRGWTVRGNEVDKF